MNLTLNLIVVFSFVVLPFIAIAEVEQPICDQSDNTQFITHDIFDLEDEQTIFLHTWANFFHIKSKQTTLVNESAFFLKKCKLNENDLLELERHLRGQKYIRNASVTFNNNQNVVVETWDNWSLMPTVSFSRKGGHNKSSFGIKERNLFGLGIDAEIESYKTNQRNGYKLTTQFPLFLGNNTNLKIRLADNDDGSATALFIDKKFVSFDTKNSYELGFDNFDQIDTQYYKGVETNRFSHIQNIAIGRWQWLHQDTVRDTLRFGIGYTYEQHLFEDYLDLLNSPQLLTKSTEANFGLNSFKQPKQEQLPNNREFSYPYVSVEYLQKDFRKLTNLNLINHIEDYNLGWHIKGLIGTDMTSGVNAPDIIWNMEMSKGINIAEDVFLFFNSEFEGEYANEGNDSNRFLLKVEAEYFHKVNDQWGAYVKNANRISRNQFADRPNVLDGENGVRGYPLQYLHGSHSTQFSFEARYYPQINIYKLLELGGAAFIDTGKVFKLTNELNTSSPWLTAIGLGARFYSTHSSEARVIHLDIIKPVTSDPNVNNIEFRITTKQSF